MYSIRIETAITTMLEAHGLNRRKSGGGFQASHTLSVALILADYEFDEDTMIAALLHDTLEDTELRPDKIEKAFGPQVLAVVRDVSEPPKPLAWRDRKLKYIQQIRESPRQGTYAVAAADKIHNLSKMAEGIRQQGENYIKPFTAPIIDMAWYHYTVLDTLRVKWDHKILREQAQCFDAFLDAAETIDENVAKFKT